MIFRSTFSCMIINKHCMLNNELQTILYTLITVIITVEMETYITFVICTLHYSILISHILYYYNL